MYKIRLILLLSIGLFMLSNMLFGAYLNYEPQELTQPDGTKLHLYATGDEYYNWLHDKDGYTIKQNKQGWYVYQDKDASGKLIPTGLIVGRNSPADGNLTPWINISPEEMRSKRAAIERLNPDNGGSRAPTSGSINNLVIFIRFSDQLEYTQTLTTYSSMFNGTSGNTMQNYFAEASYNALNVTTTFYPAASTTVVSWQDTGHTRDYYAPYNETTNTIGYNGDTERMNREHTLLVNAVNGVSSSIPTSLNLDGDNDGRVDNVCFIVQGATTAWSTLLWPHMWSLYSQYVYINSKRVYTYNFQLSNSLSSSGPGVLCHEMFHSLGAPDLYHYTSNGITPVGSWDIMQSNTNPPQHMSAYMKYKYGHWISSIPVLSTAGIYSLNPLTSSSGQCYRINSPNSTSQYFVVEYRKKTGTFESSLPGSGMIIYRINTVASGNASGPPDEVYAFRPDGTSTIDGNISSANFSTETGRTSFNSTTNPFCFLADGSNANISISAIGSSAGTTMSFTYNLSNIPQYLTGTAGVSTVSLSWQVPLSGTPTGYKVYRNSSLLATVTALNYTDNAVVNGTSYTYYITATYSSAPTESAATDAIVLMPSNSPVITIGTGSITGQGLPIEPYYGYTYSQSIYPKADINIANCNITKVAWYYNGNSAWTDAIKIYMGHTTLSSFAGTSSWIPLTGLTQVYSGNISAITTAGWIELTLNTPFSYDNVQNLVIAVDENTAGYHSGSDEFLCSAVSENRSIHFYNDSTNPDPTNPPTSGNYLYVKSSVPNVKLSFLSNPVLSLNPTSLAFGSVLLGLSTSQNFSLSNTGGGNLTGQISTPAGFNITDAARGDELSQKKYPAVNRNTISYSIAAGQNKTFTLSFSPVAAQSYNGNVTITSNSPASPNTNLVITAIGVAPVFNAPTGLAVNAGNTLVSLSWIAPTGSSGALTGYKVYRNGTLVNSTLSLARNYNDSGLINGTAYSYYVKAVYTGPDGESVASGTVNATPTGSVPVFLSVGNGSITNQHLPIEPYYGYTYSQSIYLQSDINIPNKRINKIAWQYNGNSAWSNDAVKIWMGNTSLNSFANTNAWTPVNDMSLVYDGLLSVPATAGWIELTLSTPFIYDYESNLIIAVDENTTGFHSSSDEFYCSAVTGNRSIYYYNDSTNPNPVSPLTATSVSAYIPNVKLFFEDIPIAPVFTAMPAAIDFGTIELGQNTTQQLNISNQGSGVLEISWITMTTTNEFQLLNLPASYPVYLEAGASMNLSIKYNPTEADSHSAVINITDNQSRTSHSIFISGKNIDNSLLLPYSQDFQEASFPPLNWTRYSGIIGSPSTLTAVTNGWVADGFGNSGTTGAARINIYGTAAKYWFMTPSLNLGAGSTTSKLEFDIALTAYNTTSAAATTGIDDKFAVVLSTDNGTTWTSANILKQWDNSGSADVYNNIPTTGMHVNLSLAAYSGRIRLAFYGESTVTNADNDITIDNLLINAPAPPKLVLSASAIGDSLAMGETSIVSLNMQNTGSLPLVYSIVVSDTLSRNSKQTADITREKNAREVTWLNVSSLGGTIQAGQSIEQNISLLTDNAIPDVNQAVIIINSNDPVNPSQNVSVTLYAYLLTPVVRISKIESVVSLTWMPINGATLYKVYYSNSPGGEFSYLTSTPDTNYICETTPRQGYYKVVAIHQ